MAILFGAEGLFDGRLKQAALINSDMDVLKEYSGLDNRLTYKLPEDWEVSEKNFNSKEIIYHNDFNSKDIKIHGFVEVWNINEDLKSFLDKSKSISEKQNKYKSYNIEDIKINNASGYLVNYTMENPQGVNYVAYEYFLKEDKEFVRFSFFVNEKNFKENMSAIFKSLVTTFTYKK